MADSKNTTTDKTAGRTQDDGTGDRPLVTMPSGVTPSTALATPEEREIPVTHPDSNVVGADAYNRAVTVEPVKPEKVV
ncbi:MAG TPA: hypothetical protein VJ757_00255 [Pseudonocardiaceae bacterium]|nr:hypothetical protein [Pseudonocardiaceae bacterium]